MHDQPPLEEEVRLNLQAEIEDLRWIEEMENEGGASWSAICRLPDSPAEFSLWVAAPAAVQAVAPGAGPFRERELPSTPWAVWIETWLEDRLARDAWQVQMRLASHLAPAGMGGVVDGSSGLLFHADEAAAIASAPVPPRARHLFSCTPKGEWLLTRGLRRLGLEDFAQSRSDAFHPWERRQLLEAVVDALLDGELPDAEGKLQLGPELSAWLRKGGPEGRGRVLIDERTDPTAAVLVPSSELSRRARLARERWAEFGQMFVARRDAGWRFHLRIALDESEQGPHGWWEARALRPGAFLGHPLAEEASEQWIALERVLDFLVVHPDGLCDPELSPALLATTQHPEGEI